MIVLKLFFINNHIRALDETCVLIQLLIGLSLKITRFRSSRVLL